MFSYEEVKTECDQYFNGNELAADATLNKYLLRNKQNNFVEKNPDEILQRLTKELTRIENKYTNPLSETEIYEQLKDFGKIILGGSPTYGIGNNYKLVSLSNCVVTEAPQDNISSIMEIAKNHANLYKRRAGVGTTLNNLRPEGTPVNNSAGATTGAWSFAALYSYVVRMIGQNGRRGALMLAMDVRHPDIFKFVTMKKDLTQVTGANISVQLTDEFVIAVIDDTDFQLRWPIESTNPSITKTIRAKELWQLIVETATTTAEPGVLFWDTALKYLPAECYKDYGFKTIGVNPCAEIMLSSNDSCRLLAINLASFVNNSFTGTAHFDFPQFYESTRIAMRLADDIVDLEIEKLTAIIEQADTEDEKQLFRELLQAATNGRRTGLGTLGLGDALVRMNLRYGSAESLDLIDHVFYTLKTIAYQESVQLAKEREPFPIWNHELEAKNAFLIQLPKELQETMALHGRRNISILTNAPVGTGSLVANRYGVTTGIEPIYRLSYTRRRKVDDTQATTKIDFVDQNNDKWQEYTVDHSSLVEFKKLYPQQEIPKSIFITADEIPWQERVTVQATIQRHIDHAISSTINLPKGTGSEIVSAIYLEAWKQELKGITVYVDGCRSGVLLDKPTTANTLTDAPKRPQELPCEIYHTSVLGEPYVVLIGLLNGKPYEVFGGSADKILLSKKHITGLISKTAFKTKNARYDLLIDDMKISDLVSQFPSEHGTLSRFISLSLRHTVPLHFIIEQLQKDENAALFSFQKVIARLLKKYILDGTNTSKTCPECEQKTLSYQEGCLLCTNCGFSKCG